MLLKNKTYKGIYALCDYATLINKSLTLQDYLNIIKKYDVKILQYRDKLSDINIQKQNLKFLKENLDIPIIINDKIELIEFCDGLHLGQEDLQKISQKKDLAVKLIRKKIGNKIFGISTHNEKEILEANYFELDYIGLGAYRQTNTKEVSTIIAEKASYLAKISKHDVALIGGVEFSDRVENVSYNVISSSFYK